jgi:hypothetical protein
MNSIHFITFGNQSVFIHQAVSQRCCGGRGGTIFLRAISQDIINQNIIKNRLGDV